MSKEKPQVRLCKESDTCADCGREIPSRVYADDVNPIPALLCTCKPWTKTGNDERERI